MVKIHEKNDFKSLSGPFGFFIILVTMVIMSIPHAEKYPLMGDDSSYHRPHLLWLLDRPRAESADTDR
jgi:hypothetical protein